MAADDGQPSRTQTFQVKGRACVDPVSGMQHESHVLQESNGTVWSCMLNLTDLSYGVKGHNKFYSFQIILPDSATPLEACYLFFRWGRVGAKNPPKSLKGPFSLHEAKELFSAKFLQKTENEWPLTGDFVPVRGKYSLIALDYGNTDRMSDFNTKKERNEPESKLEDSVQDLMKLICSVEFMNHEVTEMKLNLDEMPLGKLSVNQIHKGYVLLDQISQSIDVIATLSREQANAPRTRRSRRAGVSKENTNKRNIERKRLKELTSQFYTVIPHSFGMNLPPLIDSVSEISRKLEMLEVLTNIRVVTKIIKNSYSNQTLNSLDTQYASLGVSLSQVSSSCSEYDLIKRYVEINHGPTHRTYRLKIEAIHSVERSQEVQQFHPYRTFKNRMLLWHGSRVSNIAGLKIAPDEAPSTGLMFGKGIYFADIVSKSANYCWASPKQPKGVLILAEVALGEIYDAAEAMDVDLKTLSQSSKEFHALRCSGRIKPNEASYETTGNGANVPIGTPCIVAAEGPLLYNEYVVYNPAQITMRYLITVHFDFV